jgi:ferredoxin like protein
VSEKEIASASPPNDRRGVVILSEVLHRIRFGAKRRIFCLGRRDWMKITEKLALDAFKNDKETHITLDQKICHTCRERFCIYACPANLYSLNEKGEMVVEYAGCLECGTCQIACIYGSVRWKYPRSDYGVQYRFG